jgi:hypothetical protein
MRNSSLLRFWNTFFACGVQFLIFPNMFCDGILLQLLFRFWTRLIDSSVFLPRAIILVEEVKSRKWLHLYLFLGENIFSIINQNLSSHWVFCICCSLRFLYFDEYRNEFPNFSFPLYLYTLQPERKSFALFSHGMRAKIFLL